MEYSRRFSWTGHIAKMKECKSALKIVKSKPTGKRPLGKPRHGWENSIRNKYQYEELN